MPTSSTTSIRLSSELRARLDRLARQTGRGRNWIINEAIIEYLERRRDFALSEEARAQSLRAGDAFPPGWEAAAGSDPWPGR